MYKRKNRMLITALTLLLLFTQLAGAGAVDIKTEDVFINMPTASDLSKTFNGRMPDWVHFDYGISGEASLWTTDTESTWGLVYLDTYKLNAETGEYEPFNIGRYPGHMTSEGFLNYGPAYGESYYPKNVNAPGQYRSIWRVPIFGTNLEDSNVYEYAEYAVEYEITLPSIFTAVPALDGEATGEPLATPEPAFDLTLAQVEVDEEALEVTHAWHVYDPEAGDMLGQALAEAPSEIGAYVYHLRVTDGALLDESLYAYFELSAPKLFYRLNGADQAVFTSIPPLQISKPYDGQPVTVEDFAIEYDMSLVDKADETFEVSYFWWRPDANGSYNQSIAELEGQPVGPSEPGSYNLQFCLNGDNVEAYLYIIFTIEEPVQVAFEDVAEERWYYDAVLYVCDAGLFTGESETVFAPDKTMTRAMLATVLHRMMGTPETAGALPADVVEGQWYSDGVAWAFENGVMLCDQEDAFRGEDAATRQEIGFALFTCAGLAQADVSARGDMTPFADAADIADWAEQAMAWAVAANIFNGDDQGMLNPSNPATRAEVSKLMMAYMTLMGE